MNHPKMKVTTKEKATLRKHWFSKLNQYFLKPKTKSIFLDLSPNPQPKLFFRPTNHSSLRHYNTTPNSNSSPIPNPGPSPIPNPNHSLNPYIYKAQTTNKSNLASKNFYLLIGNREVIAVKI